MGVLIVTFTIQNISEVNSSGVVSWLKTNGPAQLSGTGASVQNFSDSYSSNL